MSTINTLSVLSDIETVIQGLRNSYHQISSERRSRLQPMIDYIAERKERDCKLHFICTHNSRRSQMAQAWAQVAGTFFGWKDLHTFSGGTEVTAFNPQAVQALRDCHFEIEVITQDKGDNPHYVVTYSNDLLALICYSTTFDDPVNPKSDFAAIKTCTDADQHCPIVPGAALNILLPFEDPKSSDGTAEAASVYLQRAREIGREMLFVFETAAQ